MLLSQGEGFDPYLSALIGTPNLLDFALPCPFYKGLLDSSKWLFLFFAIILRH